MQKSLLKLLAVPAVTILRVYWFIFRPKTFGVKIVLERSDGFVLLVKHTYGVKWTFPGGGLKSGEDGEAGLRREIKEELGLDINNPTFLGSFTSEVEYKKDTVFVYTTRIEKIEFKADPLEIEKLDWFDINTMPTLGPVSKTIFDMYIKYKKDE